jgi:hypothetical protein
MSAVLDTFTGQPDPGLMVDAKLESRIDAAYRCAVSLASDDAQSLEAFSEFYRLVLARSKHAQVVAEIERRRR